MSKKEIIETLDNLERMLFSATLELEKVKQSILSFEESSVIQDEVTGPPFATVPEYVTGYTLDDLYKAFGKKKKSYAHRLRTALKENNIKTLEDFLSLSPGELLKLNNIGYKTLTRTQDALKKLGIQW